MIEQRPPAVLGVLIGRTAPGVWTLSAVPPATVELARGLGWVVIDVDPAALGTPPLGKAAVLAALAEAGRFPSWFGKNWDAALDCLSDLSWFDGPPSAPLLVIVRSVAEIEPEPRATFASILDDVSDHWRSRARTCVVLWESAEPTDQPSLAGPAGPR